MNVTQLQEENEKLAGELRKTKRELNSALFQIERYKASVQGKENMSRIISAEKARRDLFLTNLLRVTPEIVLLMNDELNVVMCSTSYLEAALSLRHHRRHQPKLRLHGQHQSPRR